MPLSNWPMRQLSLLTTPALVAAAQQQAETNAVLTERERLAADFHDNLAQTLAAINLKEDTTENMLSAGESFYLVDDTEIESHACEISGFDPVIRYHP